MSNIQGNKPTTINLEIDNEDKVLLRMMPFIQLAKESGYIFDYDKHTGRVTVNVPVLVEVTDV